MITAQNPTNQGNEKLIFNLYNEKELSNALTHYDLGIMKPEYAISLIKKAEYQIEKARMSDDSKALIKNAFGLCLGLIPERYTKKEMVDRWEPCAEYLFPNEIEEHIAWIENGEDDEYETFDDLCQQICEEFQYIFYDWYEEEVEYPEGEWENVGQPYFEEYFDGFRTILDEHGDEVKEEYHKAFDSLWKQYCDLCKYRHGLEEED